MKKIHKLERPKCAESPKIKVAAYARVSTSSDDQLASLQTQITHYESAIKRNSEWEYVGIYYDEGITGTKTAKREGLKRLIKDCELGKIELILTKSISRFSRNTVDCLNLVRKLSEMGIFIFFEKENINTGDMESELMLSILSSMAESESFSISENMKWGIRKRMANGNYRPGTAPYGYKIQNDEYVLDSPFDKAVKQMFDWTLEGLGTGEIATKLNKSGIKPKRSLAWRSSSVRNILQNVAYIGVLMLQQTFTDDQFKRKANNGELPMYRIENDHEPIVSKGDFEQVQEIIRIRGQTKGNQGTVDKYHNRYAFSTNIICNFCGNKFKRIHTYWKGVDKNIKWACAGHLKDTSSCEVLPIKDVDLKIAYLTMMNKLITFREEVLEPLLHVSSNNKKVATAIADIDRLIRELESKLEVLSTLALSGMITTNIMMQERLRFQTELTTLKDKRKQLIQQSNGNSKQVLELKKLLKFVRKADPFTEWEEDLFSDFTKSVVVYNRKEVGFVLKCGLTLRERLPE